MTAGGVRKKERAWFEVKKLSKRGAARFRKTEQEWGIEKAYGKKKEKTGKTARGRKEKGRLLNKKKLLFLPSYGALEISSPEICIVEVDVYTQSLRFFFAHGTP